ncbi:ABC transporter permease [Nonomuraea sp. NPDC050556]|uniref:ABC transporter permease n=1 Tax=Nonomuraea sp. NPDC050556 TaxID=3364369 RepID=UPI0037A08E11
MIRFLIRRIISAAAIVLVVSASVFALFYALPRDPARAFCGRLCLPENLAILRHEMGMDQPVWLQFLEWLKAIVAGRDIPGVGRCPVPCFGYSFAKNEFIWETIADRMPVTVSLTAGAAAVMLTVGIGAGMVAAARRGGWLDAVATSTSNIGGSMQIFLVGPLLVFVLADTLGVLPRPSYTDLTADPGKWFVGLIIPWLSLSVIFYANYTRLTRSMLLEQLNEDYVRTARAKGLSRRAAFFRFAWRGAMIPVVTQFGIDLGVLLGGAIVTETTFGFHGLGQLVVQAFVNTDLPMLLGVTVISASAIVLMNVLVDAMYAVIDPRVRLAS